MTVRWCKAVVALMVTWTLTVFRIAISFLKGNQNDVKNGKYPKYQQILKKKEILIVLFFFVKKLPESAN